MLNGGLHQFFFNDHMGYAPHVSDALGKIGAAEMQKHYADFVSQNKLNLTRRDSFYTESDQDYIEQHERYPIDAFDNTFYELYLKEDLGSLVISYVRNHRYEVLD